MAEVRLHPGAQLPGCYFFILSPKPQSSARAEFAPGDTDDVWEHSGLSHRLGKEDTSISEQSPGTLINIPQCTGQLPTAKNYLAQMSTQKIIRPKAGKPALADNCRKKKKVPLNGGDALTSQGPPGCYLRPLPLKHQRLLRKKKKAKN